MFKNARKKALTALVAALLCLPFVPAQSQSLSQSIADSILNEGYNLYQLELAGITASRFIEENLSVEGLHGSFAYERADSIMVVFFTRNGKKEEVKYTFGFQRPVSAEYFATNGDPRKFNAQEKQLRKIRSKVVKKVNKDEYMRSVYQDAILNMIFLKRDELVSAYLLSGLQSAGVIPLGNDFVLTYKPSGKLLHTEPLHQNLIPIKARVPKSNDTVAFSTMHVHSDKSSPFITPTDVCTMFLYRHLLQWDTHFVFSEKYVSVLFLKEEKLTLMTTEEFERWKERL